MLKNIHNIFHEYPCLVVITILGCFETLNNYNIDIYTANGVFQELESDI